MQTGAITGYIDVAQVALYVFWFFFFALVFWLRREDKREGYPLVTERPGYVTEGFPPMPAPKTYVLQHGGTVTLPRVEDPQPAFQGTPMAAWPGAALMPAGNPMLSGVGPSASAIRSDTPDRMWITGEQRIMPLRVATDHFLDPEGPEPRGMKVAGADGVVAGVIIDVWIDRTEMLLRYLEVSLTAGPHVLIPAPMVRTSGTGEDGLVTVQSILGAQFVDAPKLATPDVVTLLEEEKIQAYFSSGQLYAEPNRAGPLL